MTDRSYLSIGDVLALLRDEFPDITISKIRFLESRGLLDPERTPSGYRKFYEPDVERLRWILRQQREHFLPLKVIKGRLEGGKESDDDLPVTQSLFDPACGDSPAADDEPLLVGALANGGERAEPVSRVSAIDMAAPSEEEPLVVTPVRSEVGAGPHPAPPGTFFGGVTGARSRQGPATAGDLPLTSPAVGSPASRGPEPGFGALPGSAAGSSAGASSPEGGEPRTRKPEATEAFGAPPIAAPVTPMATTGDAAALAAKDEFEPFVPPGAEGREVGAKAPAAPVQSAQADTSHETGDTEPEDSPPTPSKPPVTRQTIRPPVAPPIERPAASPTAPPAAAAATPANPSARRDPVTRPAISTGASLTAEELADVCGVTVAEIGRLEEYGLITGRAVGGDRCYDEDALVVARLAAAFARYGIEPRHLRTYKHAAEREAGLFSQVVLPLIRQRNPEARSRASDSLAEMSDLGASLQAALLKAALREITGG